MQAKGKTWAIAALCAAVLALSGYVTASEYGRQQEKKIFLNEVYFLLKDVHEQIDGQSTEDLTTSASLTAYLTELDVRCILQSQKCFARFSYPRPGAFERIRDNIGAGAYIEEEIRKLSAQLQEMIKALSDESGQAEEPRLTDQEVDRIFSDFCSAWD